MRVFSSRIVNAGQQEAAGTWYPGLPHILAALAAWPVFGAASCVAGLLMASLVSFVVWLPMTALSLNNGVALGPNDAAPALTSNAKRALFALWTATAWFAAAIAR